MTHVNHVHIHTSSGTENIYTCIHGKHDTGNPSLQWLVNTSYSTTFEVPTGDYVRSCRCPLWHPTSVFDPSAATRELGDSSSTGGWGGGGHNEMINKGLILFLDGLLYLWRALGALIAALDGLDLEMARWSIHWRRLQVDGREGAQLSEQRRLNVGYRFFSVINNYLLCSFMGVKHQATS